MKCAGSMILFFQFYLYKMFVLHPGGVNVFRNPTIVKGVARGVSRFPEF